MMNKMIVSNLAHRPLRSAISVVAIALEVTLILLIVGFALGMLHDSRSRQAGIGADVIVLPPGSSNIVGLSDAAIPVKMADIFSKLPHVAVVSPVILKVSAAGTLQSMTTYLSTFTPDKYPMLSTFINIVIGISVTIGFIVIFQSMYTAVMERTREIGILKSLGASKLYVVNVILRETTLLAIGGIIVGIAISLIASAGIRQRTTLTVDITSSWLLRAAGIAIVVALAGAVYPALKAAQKDPIDALAYE